MVVLVWLSGGGACVKDEVHSRAGHRQQARVHTRKHKATEGCHVPALPLPHLLSLPLPLSLPHPLSLSLSLPHPHPASPRLSIRQQAPGPRHGRQSIKQQSLPL